MNEEIEVLLVDDDEDDRDLIQMAINDIECEIKLRCFEHGQALIDFLETSDESASYANKIILLDLNMPVLNGKETLSFIRKNKRFSRIPVIILTTSASVVDVDDCYEGGANAFITKSNSYAEIVNVMTRTCDFWGKAVTLPSS